MTWATKARRGFRKRAREAVSPAQEMVEDPAAAAVQAEAAMGPYWLRSLRGVVVSEHSEKPGVDPVRYGSWIPPNASEP